MKPRTPGASPRVALADNEAPGMGGEAMKTLTDLVPTREVCEQLKAAGMPQGETALVWCKSIVTAEKAYVTTRAVIDESNRVFICAAPTVGEMLELMPRTIEKDEHYLMIENVSDGWWLFYQPVPPKAIEGLQNYVSLVFDACPEMLFWLHEHGYIWQEATNG